MINTQKILSIFSLALVLSSCVDMDPFNLSNKDIIGDYYLSKWEDGKTFYLHDSKRAYEEFEDYGPIGGTVLEIGWSRTLIIVKRNAHFDGDPDGWMVIDSVNKIITGPYALEEIAENKKLKEIKVMSASQAWEKL